MTTSQHHIAFVEDRKQKQYVAFCSCGWEMAADTLIEAHSKAAIHDLDIEEEEV